MEWWNWNTCLPQAGVNDVVLDYQDFSTIPTFHYSRQRYLHIGGISHLR